jgi:hypothetical protein
VASNIHFSATIRNAMLDALNAIIGSGAKLRIYSGTQPADTGASEAGTLLAELALASTPLAAASGGAASFNTITDDASADDTGTATHFSIRTSGGARLIEGTVGTSGADLNMNTTSFVAGADIAVTSFALQISA